MKKLLRLVGLLMFASLRPAAAEVSVPVPVGTGAYAPSPPPATDIYFHIGPLNLNIPWDNVNAVYLYDLNAKRNLVGGEAVVASLWRIQATVGGVTSLDGHGAPFFGGNLWFTNPIPQIAILNQIKPGIFGGWDWNKGQSMFGFKAAIPIF